MNRFESLLSTVQRGKNNAARRSPEHEESINVLKCELTKTAKMPTRRTLDATIWTRRVQTGSTGNTLRELDFEVATMMASSTRGSLSQ